MKKINITPFIRGSLDNPTINRIFGDLYFRQVPKDYIEGLELHYVDGQERNIELYDLPSSRPQFDQEFLDLYINNPEIESIRIFVDTERLMEYLELEYNRLKSI